MMSDNISFEGMTAGQMLRAARESRGLSIDDICQKLKMRQNVVEALENDAGSSLKMAQVFVKGHARALAEHLGIPADIFKAALDSCTAYVPSSKIQEETSLSSKSAQNQNSSAAKAKNSGNVGKQSFDAGKTVMLTAMAAVACGCIYFALAGNGQGTVSEEQQNESDVKVDVYEFEGMADIDVSKVDSENFDPNAYAPTADLTADSIKNRPQSARLEEFKAMQQGKEVPLTAVTGQTSASAGATSEDKLKAEPKVQSNEDAAASVSKNMQEKESAADFSEKIEQKAVIKAEAPKGEDPNAPKKLVQDEQQGKPLEGEIEVSIPMNAPSSGSEEEKREQQEAKAVSEIKEIAKDESAQSAPADLSEKNQDQNAKQAEEKPVAKADGAAASQSNGLKPEGTRTRGTLEIAKADSYTVSFSFKEECWVEVKSAGKVVASKLNPAGTSLEAVAPTAPVSLKFGAPQAVVLLINGEPVDLSNAKPGSLYKLEISAK